MLFIFKQFIRVILKSFLCNFKSFSYQKRIHVFLFTLEKSCSRCLAGWVSEFQQLPGVVIQFDRLNVHLEEMEYIFNC